MDLTVVQKLRSAIRDIPDYPKPGILFRDVTTLLRDGQTFALACEWMCESANAFPEFRFVAGIESRGFIFGAVLAGRLGKAFVPVRKPGKLPAPVWSEVYALEYGQDILEVHRDAVVQGEKYLVVDDLLATGGTANAACKLIEKGGGEVAGCLFLIELKELKGRKKIAGYTVQSLIEFEGR